MRGDANASFLVFPRLRAEMRKGKSAEGPEKKRNESGVILLLLPPMTLTPSAQHARSS